MKDSIVKLAKKLISIPSEKGNSVAIKQVLSMAKNELKSFPYKKYEKNGIPSLLFYNTSKLPKEFKLILNAHLDVVPAKQNQYKPKIVGDKLFGRGAYDMKAAAASEILVFIDLARQVKYPLGLQLVTDEEIGGFDGAKYQRQRGVRTSCMLAGECSTNLSIGVRAKGIIWVKIVFEGVSAHAAYLWEGKNAVYSAMEFLGKLWRAYPIPTAKVWQTTVNVASIGTTNVTNNKVPGDATIGLDIRYLAGEDKITLKKIKSMLPKKASLKISEYEPARDTDEENWYVKKLQTSAKRILKRDIQIIGMNSGSDLRHYPEAAGLEFGPIGYGAHKDFEWVSIRSLESYQEILRDFLLSLN